MTEQEPIRFTVGEIVRGPVGRPYRIVKADNDRHLYLVERIRDDGQSDARFAPFTFPAGYLTRVEVQG